MKLYSEHKLTKDTKKINIRNTSDLKNSGQHEQVYVIIAAAGSGERAGFQKNKLFCTVDSQPLIIKTVQKFLNAQIDKIIVSVSEADYCQMEKLLLPLSPKIELCIGGATRTDSVVAALERLIGGIVLIHDGARPYVTDKIINDCIESVKMYKSGIAAVKATDTTVSANDGFITSYTDREALYRLQTPQGFYTEDIKRAYALISKDKCSLHSKKSYTDDSSVYAQIAVPKLFLSEPFNIKFTYKEDFKDCMNMYTGIGFDTHRLVKDRKLILGGVEIESELGLLGHSDADALTHAIMDALLSSAGLKDIGCHFPDTDERYKNASSIELLKEVVNKLSSMDLKIKNVSAVIVAQQPRLSPYIDKMTQTLATVMHISTERVGITVSTAEQMGFIGRSEGIAVTASCLTYKEHPEQN